MSASHISLALVNANVLTMESAESAVPQAEAVAISADRIAAVGSNSDIRGLASRGTRFIDCQGQTLLPGFNDAHLHLAGLARRLQDLNCTPQHAPSIAALQSLIRGWAAARVPGTWVRGFGYDDLQLTDRRHPDRHDLDSAAPHHPAWLQHRSGHASSLNSRALDLAGIHREMPDPPGGVIERDRLTGEPTGVIIESQSFLRQRLGNIRSPENVESGMRSADRLLASYGITSVQDAGADNGLERWKHFSRLQSDGILRCRITMFASIGRLEELSAAALYYGSGDQLLRLGHAKIMLTLTAGALHPLPSELETTIAEAHSRGYPVAMHCVEEEAIAVAAALLQDNRQPGLSDRIEHCAEGTPPLIEWVRRSGANVVTQPGFLYHNGLSYRENVEARLLPHLYPAGALLRAGVATAFGSDAPVIDPNPWPAICSAVTRRASDGELLSGSGQEEQTVSVIDALRMYTICGAEAEGASTGKGSLQPGKLADLVLVDANLLSMDHSDLADVKPVLTIAGGLVVWGNV